MWICLFHASRTEPGFLERNVPEYHQAIKQVNKSSKSDISDIDTNEGLGVAVMTRGMYYLSCENLP